MEFPYSDKYEAVIGLEVHAQLSTRTKLFCGDEVLFGAPPNTLVSAVTLAHPGTLPVINRAAIAMAVKAGLALECEIEKVNYFARKHYFYPDLPKGYQLSQHTTPICKNGKLTISVGQKERTIRINRIHLEEDAGKSIHDMYPQFSAVDYNRAGVPLIEVVSEPDLRSGEEAAAYFNEIRKLVRALGICDGNMEEGSLRCDANISVRLRNETKLGIKVEVKNLNSLRFLRKAVDYEVQRMITLLEEGKTVVQQTRGYDENTETTYAIRNKEEAEDYRYFPDPDLPPFHVSAEMIENIRQTLPETEKQRTERLMQQYQLTAADAGAIACDIAMTAFFEEAARHCTLYKPLCNWLMGPVRAVLNENNEEMEDLSLTPMQLASLITLVDSGKVSHTLAVQKIFPVLLERPNSLALDIAEEMGFTQEQDEAFLLQLVDEVLAGMPAKVQEYKKGKKGLIGLFTGEVMKRSGGKADPRMVNRLLQQKLS